MSQTAEEFLRERILHDPETDEVYCTIDVVASMMRMFSKGKLIEYKNNMAGLHDVSDHIANLEMPNL